MMLDFYGITLVSSDTGELARADNYKERFDHLNRYVDECVGRINTTACLCN